jgi:hypothetical protein
MAVPGNSFIAALTRYGMESDEKKAQLITWKDAALTAIAEGNGGDIASGSGNGVAFTKMIAMTTAEWFTALDRALAYANNGTLPSSRTIARLG